MTDDDVAGRILAARDRLERSRPAVEAGAPWPLAERFDDAPEASWGPPEVLAHLVEMVGFWTAGLDEVALTGGGPEPVPFGRTAADPARLANIERGRREPIPDQYAQLRTAIDAFLGRWAAWTPAQRGHLGAHSRLGPMSVAAGVDRFITTHLVDHAEQLEAILAAEPARD